MSQRDSGVFIESVAGISAAGDSVMQAYEHLLSGEFYLKDIDLSRSGSSVRQQVYSYAPTVSRRLRQLSQTPPWHRSDVVQRLWFETCSDLGLERLSAAERERCGLIVGSSRGIADLLETTIVDVYGGGGEEHKKHRRPAAHTSPYTTPSSLAALVAQHYGLQGGQAFVSSACTSSLSSLIFAYQCLRGGMMSHCVSGGAEACATPYVVQILQSAGVWVRQVSSVDEGVPLRSFGCNPSGMVLGEGAGAVLLSSSKSAQSVAEVVGVGMAGESCGLVGLSHGAEFLQQAFSRGLAECRWTADDIDLVGLHGSGTLRGDAAEIVALRQLFSAVRRKPRLLVSKWATGHTLGAAGVLQLGFALQACAKQELPTYPYQLDAAVAEFDSCPARAWRNICVWGMGFGGSACAVFLRYLG